MFTVSPRRAAALHPLTRLTAKTNNNAESHLRDPALLV
jgi:hypothetical protein